MFKMAKEFAKRFYKTKEWQHVRHMAWVRDHGMCQYPGCNRPAEEVHHIKHLTPENITDPAVALSLDNLKCLCRDHHFMVHQEDRAQGRKDWHRTHIPQQSPLLDAVQFVDGRPVKVKAGRIDVLCGLIGAGKSTWAAGRYEHITDLDAMSTRSKRRQIMETLALAEQGETVCHIATYPTAQELESFGRFAGAVRFLLVDVSEDEAEARIKKRGRARDIENIDEVLKKNHTLHKLIHSGRIEFVCV